MCNSDGMLNLFKRVCRKYIYLYPEMITSEIYTYKDMYEETEKDWIRVYIDKLINSSIMGKQKAGSCVKLEKLDNYGVALTEISGWFALI